MYYTVTITESNGKTSCFNIEAYEYNDQYAYCREGLKAGWIVSCDIVAVTEEY